MDERILVVDDEAPLLKIIERMLGADFSVFCAPNGPEALDLMRQQGPFAVVVSDMRMPEMSGLELLQRVRQTSPDTVRLMCSGDGDLQTAVKAVNDGEVFRFITKPFTGDSLRATMRASLEHYRLLLAERTLLERTLNGLTQVLMDVVALANPIVGDCTARVRPCALHLARIVAPDIAWQVDLAAMLSQLGCLTIAPELLEDAYGGSRLKPDEVERMASHPKVAHAMLSHVPRLELVAAIVLGQQRQRHQSKEETQPFATRDRAILGAQILRVALEYDRLLARGESRAVARSSLEWLTEEFDPAIVRALESYRPPEAEFEVKRIAVAKIEPGMILEEDLRTSQGVLVVPKACTITGPMVHRFRDSAGNLPEDVLVRTVRR